jgi:TatD DNase family protein
MIDTHCHLTDPRLGDQLAGVLQRCAAAGVTRMITIGTGLEDDRAVVKLASTLPNVRCAIGVHPNYSAEVDLSDLPLLKELQSDPSVVALGEMGLDYHYDHSPPDKQKAVFEYQLQLATDVKRPVVIHCREAVDDCLAILKDFPEVRADFHCFTGDRDEAKRILDAGHWLGFTGPVTFKKSDELRAVVKLTPLDRLLVETDAPYLTPEPMRKQKINEPALVVQVALTVAELKQMDYSDLEEIVDANATRFFGW